DAQVDVSHRLGVVRFKGRLLPARGIGQDGLSVGEHRILCHPVKPVHSIVRGLDRAWVAYVRRYLVHPYEIIARCVPFGQPVYLNPLTRLVAELRHPPFTGFPGGGVTIENVPAALTVIATAE